MTNSLHDLKLCSGSAASPHSAMRNWLVQRKGLGQQGLKAVGLFAADLLSSIVGLGFVVKGNGDHLDSGAFCSA